MPLAGTYRIPALFKPWRDENRSPNLLAELCGVASEISDKQATRIGEFLLCVLVFLILCGKPLKTACRYIPRPPFHSRFSRCTAPPPPRAPSRPDSRATRSSTRWRAPDVYKRQFVRRIAVLVGVGMQQLRLQDLAVCIHVIAVGLDGLAGVGVVDHLALDVLVALLVNDEIDGVAILVHAGPGVGDLGLRAVDDGCLLYTSKDAPRTRVRGASFTR